MVHSPIGNSSAKANRSSHWFCGTFCFLCAASFVIVTFLFLSIIFVVLDIPLGIQPITLGSLILKIYHKLLLPLVGYFASILRVMFPWPALVLFILAIVIWGPDRISRILSNIGTIELPGWIKFEGKAPSKEFQKELGEAARFVERANREIGEAYEGAKRFASDLRERTDIPRLVSNAAKQVAQKVGERCPEDYRLTLYVADFVFSDRLYQFTEYYNSQGDAISSGKAGRTFSIRYGIIGRVWRSGVHEIEGNLISTQEQTHVDDDNIERFIARRWGLTLREAIHVRA
jgi:hypothetical protein